MGRESYYAFIGTNSVRGSRGIYTLRIDAETGIAMIMSTAPAYNTGCLALSQDGGNLYAAAEGMTFDGYADGGVMAFRVNQDGSLHRLNGQRSYGQRTCCVAVDREKKTYMRVISIREPGVRTHSRKMEPCHRPGWWWRRQRPPLGRHCTVLGPVKRTMLG